LAIELAKMGDYEVAGLDISESFVRLARERALIEGVAVDFRQGDAAHMPFESAIFDYVVCRSAFKNFTDPVGALNEMHRVLRPGGQASIQDLGRNASMKDIAREVDAWELPRLDALITKLTFGIMVWKTAWARPVLEDLISRSLFGSGEIIEAGIGFEVRLTKPTEDTIGSRREEPCRDAGDDDAIRALLGVMSDAWCRGDGQEYASVFSEDATYVNAPGRRLVGRQSIAAFHQRDFDGLLKDTRLGAYPYEIQWLTPDVALVHAAGTVLFRGENESDVSPNGLLTLVALRGGGRHWEFVSFSNTPTGKGRNMKFLLRYIRSRFAAFGEESSKARKHMLQEKETNMASWEKRKSGR
jgi:uncharacterized protein (TIGR02246 family)